MNGLIKALRRLPKNHRVKLIMLGYGRLAYWIDWEAEKHGIPIKVVNPRGTSTKCPMCGVKMIKVGYRRLKCPRCRFEEDRDVITVINLSKMGSMTNETTSKGRNHPPKKRRRSENNI
ncbi:transposase, IS605 OrfB family [Vulcanisaeta moutnovskia 768-28]|uniref:Transposase, IS605 OrfB family n=1 Tax=Vulcanisaeta moutnovskia (strain 768-28) TaxID=985053 RepID=F0QU09_VULM7|nr:transposase, IS605 OrfB family [Vulcanisaeta moutnovskia 768-28]